MNKPSEEEILSIRSPEDPGFEACMSHANNIIKGVLP